MWSSRKCCAPANIVVYIASLAIKNALNHNSPKTVHITSEFLNGHEISINRLLTINRFSISGSVVVHKQKGDIEDIA